MVKSMAAAGQVPHFHLMDEVIVTRLAALRTRLRGDPSVSGQKLSFLPFILKVQSPGLSPVQHLPETLPRERHAPYTSAYGHDRSNWLNAIV